tara:strand:- start:632 stop:880 length:249 start_codon:yes stop_codon:yes gene_type:complete
MEYPSLTINQEALSICPALIEFECPICNKSKYSKKKALHTIPSNGNIDNRVEIYNTKCNDMKCIFFITITDKTEKLNYRLGA